MRGFVRIGFIGSGEKSKRGIKEQERERDF